MIKEKDATAITINIQKRRLAFFLSVFQFPPFFLVFDLSINEKSIHKVKKLTITKIM